MISGLSSKMTPSCKWPTPRLQSNCLKLLNRQFRASKRPNFFKAKSTYLRPISSSRLCYANLRQSENEETEKQQKGRGIKKIQRNSS